MLTIDSSSYLIDTSLFEKTIGVTGFDMYIDIYKYNLLLVSVAGMFDTVRDLLTDKIKYCTLNSYTNISNASVSYVLENIFHVEDYGFKVKTARGSMSLSVEKVFKPLRACAQASMERNPSLFTDILEFCDLYIEYSSLKHLAETMKKKKEIIIETDLMDNFGHKLSKVSSFYERRSTGRYYTNSDNLQGWNLEMVSSFTAPKDYFFIWADFDQIDLRVAANLILFNGHPEMIKQFNETPDKYEAVARIIATKMKKQFDPIKFKANRKAYKRTVLARLYGASKRTMATSGFTDKSEIETLDNYYNTHEYYQWYVNKLKSAIGFGADVHIKDYFGVERVIPLKEVNGQRTAFEVSRALEQCLNTPIQSTSNDIVMIWVNEITKFFREKGFDYDKFRIALLRHDEGLFLVHKDCMPYLWIFDKYSTIKIDNWSDLTIQPSLGYNYKVEDDVLTKKYNSIVNSNLDSVSSIDSMPLHPAKKWIPCYNVASVFCYAPVPSFKFALMILSRDERCKEQADELYNMIVRRDSNTVKFAVNCIRDYRGWVDANPKLLKCIENFNRYFNYMVVSIDNGTKVKVNTKKFLSYLKENNVGYVYMYNPFFVNYDVVDGIQFRYSTDIFEDRIIRELDMFDN